MAGGHVAGAVGHGPDHHHLQLPVSGHDPACPGRYPAGAGLPHPAAGEPGPAMVLAAVHRHRLGAQCVLRVGGSAGGCEKHPGLCGHGHDVRTVLLPVAGHGGGIPCSRRGKTRRPCRRCAGDLLRGDMRAGLPGAERLAGGAAAIDRVYRDPAESGKAGPLSRGHGLRHPRRAGAPALDGGAVGLSGADAGGGAAGHVPGSAVSYELAGA